MFVYFTGVTFTTFLKFSVCVFVFLVQHLMNRVSSFMHVYTLYSAVRPFGCSLVMGSYGPEGPSLYMADPSGVSWVRQACVYTYPSYILQLIIHG